MKISHLFHFVHLIFQRINRVDKTSLNNIQNKNPKNDYSEKKCTFLASQVHRPPILRQTISRPRARAIVEILIPLKFNSRKILYWFFKSEFQCEHTAKKAALGSMRYCRRMQVGFDDLQNLRLVLVATWSWWIGVCALEFKNFKHNK